MARVNNVDLDGIVATIEAGKKDPSSVRRKMTLSGEWRTSDSGSPQFVSTINYEKGSLSVEVDSPTFLGGGGSRPGPLHYCLLGLSSCFLSTYVTVASLKGVVLRSAKVTVECDINFSKVLGLSNDPIVEGVKFTIEIESDADAETLREINKEAEERCPAVYSLSTPLKITTEVIKRG